MPAHNPYQCPCNYIKACREDCTCTQPFSSVGCDRCCTYGSEEQRAAMAQEIIERERLARLGAAVEARVLRTHAHVWQSEEPIGEMHPAKRDRVVASSDMDMETGAALLDDIVNLVLHGRLRSEPT